MKTSGGLTTSGDDPETATATISPPFHTQEEEVTQFESSSQQPGHSIVIDFLLI